MRQDMLQKEFLDLYLGMQRMNRALGKHLEPGPLSLSLTTAQINALIALSQQAPQNMSQLAGGLMVSRQQLTHIIDTLVREGLVSRAGSEANRRVVLVELTGTGRNIVQQLGEAFLRNFPDNQGHVHKLQQAVMTVNSLMAATTSL